jgi:hypothetical protein
MTGFIIQFVWQLFSIFCNTNKQNHKHLEYFVVLLVGQSWSLLHARNTSEFNKSLSVISPEIVCVCVCDSVYHCIQPVSFSS